MTQVITLSDNEDVCHWWDENGDGQEAGIISGHGGRDWIDGDGGDDFIYGQGGTDYLFGGKFPGITYPWPFDDFPLVNEPLIDGLSGFWGNDYLIGGDEKDVMASAAC